MLKTLPINLVSVDSGLAMLAGMLRPSTREAGLSLGGCFCLALAKRDGLPAWTAEKAWKKVAAAAEVRVIVIR
jgi:PIN domain nuclease of toxin-antitoxin system